MVISLKIIAQQGFALLTYRCVCYNVVSYKLLKDMIDQGYLLSRKAKRSQSVQFLVYTSVIR